MPSPLLSASNLSCTRDKRAWLFAPLSFDLWPGDALIIRGENGCGKSTLLRTLAGLHPVRLGHVTRTAPLTYLGHANALHPSLTLAEQLSFWRACAPAVDVSDEKLLTHLGLEGKAHHLTAQCSNGQKRRLSFARLILEKAPIWLLDEPQAALDANGYIMLADLITRHLDHGGCVVMASHQDITLDSSQTIELKVAA